jgi:hypothetical protein
MISVARPQEDRVNAASIASVSASRWRDRGAFLPRAATRLDRLSMLLYLAQGWHR